MSHMSLLTTKQVASRLGVSEKTVRRYVHRGILRSVQLPGCYRFRVEDLNAFLMTHTHLYGDEGPPAFWASLNNEDIAILNEDHAE